MLVSLRGRTKTVLSEPCESAKSAVGSAAVDEIAPGLWHWRALRESIHSDVDSYWLEPEGVVVDPMLPPGGSAAFGDSPPAHVLLTCRHHDRDAWTLRAELGCTVHVVASGAHELEGRGPFETFAWGDELPGGVVAQEVDAISPDETALWAPAHRALVVADGVVRWPGKPGLSFVPDSLMDDPERTRTGLLAAFRRLLDTLDLEHVLLAHGGPATAGELRAFVQGS
jgi:hypothetical protein